LNFFVVILSYNPLIVGEHPFKTNLPIPLSDYRPHRDITFQAQYLLDYTIHKQFLLIVQR